MADTDDAVRLRLPTPVAVREKLPKRLARVLAPGCGCRASARRSAGGA